MRKTAYMITACATMALALSACSRVYPGYVGVRVNSIGTERGVEGPLTQGWYYTGMFSTVYEFPTFTQNQSWKGNETVPFNDVDGLILSSDIGISYHVEAEKAPLLFQKYRRGIDEITDVYIRNMVHNALVQEAAKYKVEYIYGGEGRTKILTSIEKDVGDQVKQYGLVIENLYWIGQLGMPETLKTSITNKMQAQQNALQVQNEVASATAEAQKKVAEANGEAQSTLLKAEAQAKANELLAKSLTGELIQQKYLEKWNGQLPQISGSTGGMLLNIPSVGK